MTWNDRKANKWEIPILDHEIAVTDAACTNADQYLTMAWYRDGAVLKLVRDFRGGDSRWPSQPHASDPYYWRREPLVYESGLLGRLRGGLGAPAFAAY